MLKTILILMACINIMLAVGAVNAVYLSQEQLDAINPDTIGLQPQYTAVHYSSRAFYANISLLDIKRNQTNYLIYRHTYKLKRPVTQDFIDCYQQATISLCFQEKILPVWIAQYRTIDSITRQKISNYQTHQDIDNTYDFNLTG